MAVSLVGTGTFITSTINGTSLALTFSTGAAASGDLVIAWWVNTRALTNRMVSSAGTAYTVIGSLANGNIAGVAAYRFLTSSENTVASCNTGSAQDAVQLAAIVLRGVNNPIVLDAESTTGTSSNPNTPAASVQESNSAVVTAVGMLARGDAYTAPTGFANTVSTGGTDTRIGSAALAYKSTNTSTVDPSSWTGAISGAWIGFTITVKSTEFVPPRNPIIKPDIINYSVPMIGY